MPAPSTRGVGNRIATARRAHRKTQDQLARDAGISRSLLEKIEQGRREALPGVVDSIADALGIDVSRLLGDGAAGGRIEAALPALRAAIDAYDMPADGPVRPLHALQAAVDEVVAWRLASQYTRLARELPPLLGELTRAVAVFPEPERARAAGLLASAYRAADAVAYKHQLVDLSGRLVELVRWAAAQARDDAHTAAAAYVRTETFFQTRNHDAGLRALEAAIDAAPPPADASSAASRVALHMRAAVVAGRMTRPDVAADHFAEARAIVGLVPEGVYCGTAVGWSSLRTHEVAAAAELGDAGGVLGIAREWKPGRELPPERRSHFYIEVARAQMWAGRPRDAFESLQVARKIAPEHARGNPRVRSTAARLMQLHRTPPEALVGYARWAGAV